MLPHKYYTDGAPLGVNGYFVTDAVTRKIKGGKFITKHPLYGMDMDMRLIEGIVTVAKLEKKLSTTATTKEARKKVLKEAPRFCAKEEPSLEPEPTKETKKAVRKVLVATTCSTCGAVHKQYFLPALFDHLDLATVPTPGPVNVFVHWIGRAVLTAHVLQYHLASETHMEMTTRPFMWGSFAATL